MSSDDIQPFDIGTIGSFQNAGFTAESVPPVHLDPAEVPPEFQHLIPYAEAWGISCDARRGDFASKQPVEASRAFWYAVEPHRQAINQWIDALPDWTTAGRRFMIMLKAHGEEMPAEELAKLRKRLQEMPPEELAKLRRQMRPSS